jgi:Tfp pilus assembly protein PilN
MTRINLLPPEIQARRQAERRMVYVVVGALALAVVLAGVWMLGFLGVQSRETELAAVEQQVRTAQAEAERLAIFEQTAAELQSRTDIVARALAGRRDWARLFDELSLVLPSDLWAEAMFSSETDGITIQGWAIDAPNDTPDAGHKSIAKMLVRLADLEQLQDVWLTNSVKTLYLEQDAIQFTVTAQVKDPSAAQGVEAGSAETSGQ